MHKLDYEKNADYIISKVFDNGSLQDILEIMAWYGDNKSKESLNERALPERNNDGICIQTFSHSHIIL
jgi:hypothetical protein